MIKCGWDIDNLGSQLNTSLELNLTMPNKLWLTSAKGKNP